LKSLFLGSAGIIALAAGGPAWSADLPTSIDKASSPVYTPASALNWSGFYGGLNAGWGVEHDGGKSFCFTPAGVLNGVGCIENNVPGGGAIHEAPILGVQFGYNSQVDWLVFGVESDLQFSDVNGAVYASGPFAVTGGGISANGFSADEKHSWFGTIRGRIGITWERALLYATGGLAFGHVTADTYLILPAGTSIPASGAFTKIGWVGGGGIEYAFTDAWSVKLESLWYSLGEVSINGTLVPLGSGPAFSGGKNFDTMAAIFRAGVNYRFQLGVPHTQLNPG
jgi:outer membrane immunogenic protein